MLMRQEVAAFIAREQLLTAGQRVVAAVSGGPDSLCLLDCLDHLGFDVRVAHLDHGLRPNSWREAEFVLRQARQRGLPAIIERQEPGRWRRRGTSLEEAARLARYRFLVAAAREWRATAIATGHTADDQAETVLMHLLRGAGVHGLRGMLPRTSLSDWAGVAGAHGLVLVRPLLSSWRHQTESYCRAAGLRPRRDRSNTDPAFFRNRLRHRLLPELERYNPRVRQALTRTADVMRAEAELFDEVLAAVEPGVLRVRSDGTATIGRQAYLSQPAAIQRALMLAAAYRLVPGLRDFGFDAVERARARILQTAVGRRSTLAGGIELLDEGDRVVLKPGSVQLRYPGFPQLVALDPQSMTPPARLPLQEGALLVLPGRAPPAGSQARSARLTDPLWIDRGRLESRLVVRAPQPGDRMRPLGMQGHRKLSDIFSSLRIPAGARRNWPVVTSGGDIVCLAGLRIGHDVRLTRETRQAVELRVELSEGDSP
jgi:tRNA(Ile)-lysidine synthase